MLLDFTKETFDIIVQGGQSNAEGYGVGLVDDPYDPDPNVFYLNSDLIVVPATEKVRGNEIQSNFSLSFAREYIKNGKLAEGRKILIVRAAIAGTGFLDKRWGMEDDLYLHMIKMIEVALKLNRDNRLIALLWHQGETDALYNATFEQHYNNLMNLLMSVRKQFSKEDLPFIAGDFVQQWKNENIEICTPVVEAIRKVCQDCRCGAFVESDGLLSNYQEHSSTWDHIHFSRKAIYELGKRYFEKFLQCSEYDCIRS